MKTKPFDIVQAKAGKTCIPIIYEDNQSNMQYECKYHFSIQNTKGMALHIFQGIHATYPPALFIVNDTGEAYTTAFTRYSTYLDLCMKVEEKEYWIATGISTSGALFYGSPCLSEDSALSSLNFLPSTAIHNPSIQTHKIIRYE